MSFMKICSISRQTRMPIFSEVATFFSKIPVEAQIFIRSKLYTDDLNDKLFPPV